MIPVQASASYLLQSRLLMPKTLYTTRIYFKRVLSQIPAPLTNMGTFYSHSLPLLFAELERRSISFALGEPRHSLALKLEAHLLHRHTGRQQQQITLLDLPAEIRLAIWRLIRPEIIHVISCVCAADFHPGCQCGSDYSAEKEGCCHCDANTECLFRKLPDLMNLRLICRQITDKMFVLPKLQFTIGLSPNGSGDIVEAVFTLAIYTVEQRRLITRAELFDSSFRQERGRYRLHEDSGLPRKCSDGLLNDVTHRILALLEEMYQDVAIRTTLASDGTIMVINADLSSPKPNILRPVKTSTQLPKYIYGAYYTWRVQHHVLSSTCKEDEDHPMMEERGKEMEMWFYRSRMNIPTGGCHSVEVVEVGPGPGGLGRGR
jgi:hypothetical protein